MLNETLSGIIILSLGILLFLGIYTQVRCESRIKIQFLAVLIAMSLSFLGQLLELNVYTTDGALMARKVQFLGAPFLGVVNLFFVAAYCEVKINKNMLERLASDKNGELTEVASQIEDGSFMKKSPKGSDVDVSDSNVNSPGSSGATGMNPFESTIARISEELVTELRKHATSSNTGELKSALRSYITMLEELYSQI